MHIARIAWIFACIQKMRPNVGRAKVTHVGLFTKYIVFHEVNFSLDIGLRFLLYCLTSILYTDARFSSSEVTTSCRFVSVDKEPCTQDHNSVVTISRPVHICIKPSLFHSIAALNPHPMSLLFDYQYLSHYLSHASPYK